MVNMELSETTDVSAILKSWEDEQTTTNYNPVPTLTRLAEIIEVETDNYLKMDPDPFDERHPSRADPECQLGHILKVLFKKDNFMTKLVNDYLRDTFWTRQGTSADDINKLNIAACRLMLDIMPGLETSAVFQPDMDGLIQRLIKWATNSIEPLQTYATGLLAAAMEVPEIATRFRDQNTKMVPLMLQRLRRLQMDGNTSDDSSTSRPFAHLAPPTPTKTSTSSEIVPESSITIMHENGFMSPPRIMSPVVLEPEFQTPVKSDTSLASDSDAGSVRKKMRIDYTSESPTAYHGQSPSIHKSTISMQDTSNSSWAELESYVIGSVQMFPPTHSTRQMLILRYLTPMGEYQEFLSHAFENRALELILGYVNVRETKDSRLAFEALKYLAALLCHKKFSIEFINVNGLQRLLDVPRPSVAATGVSICLYYLAYCVDAMERVCLLPHSVVRDLCKYSLWLLECSHDSGRCHATMFFGLTFQFRIILVEFDEQDGLRKLYNVISTLPILSLDEDYALNDDAECAARQIVRHVCVAFKRYLEAHLCVKADHLRNAHLRQADRIHTTNYKASKPRPEEVQEQIETLFQLMPFRSHWSPVDQLLKLGGITLLLQIIAFAYEWNYSGRAETVRSALDILAICSVMPKVQVLFCDRVDLPEETITVGINIILGAADGEIVADPDVQKAALSVIVNCVCAPIHRVGGRGISLQNSGSPSKKTRLRSSEELIQKVWESVRSNSGIMVLLQLMSIKTPITDADCIRTLACRALAGLARSDTVKQIVSKLPLFTNGQLQNLMRDPILQEKRQEHVSFQKYALELMERLSGKSKHPGNDLEVSLANIHRANVVAQTRIQFNDRQLLQLVHQHLVSRGLSDSATILQKEANLATAIIQPSLVNTPTPFRYTSPAVTNRPRLSVGSSHHHRSGTSQTPSTSRTIQSEVVPHTPTINGSGPSGTPHTPNIKITRKSIFVTPNPTTPQNSRLQKQISYEPKLGVAVQPVTAEDGTTSEPRITLDSIITEYLTNQHALCKNPMSTCPQFNLFAPHKCPDPKPRITSSNNFTTRVNRRQLGFQSRLDKRFIHSRFCPVQCIRMPTDDGFFTCARFMPGDQTLIVGDYSGEVKTFNIQNGTEESTSVQCHDSYIVHIEPNRNGTLILTCSTWGRPLSSVWSKDFLIKHSFEEEEYVEFNKLTQDRIIGTKGETATIYDTITGTKISRLSPTISNQYTKNKATFSPTDELILSDGVLWDVNSNQQIHKLDKLNQTQSGVFHPNGLEIVSNTEVWDLRTFHLLKTVPTLNQSQVCFSPANNAIYSIALEQENDDDTNYDSSFKTLDSSDYGSIATIDVKRNIYDLCINSFDSQIALVENQGLYHSIQESVVRVYDVGRRRDDEDEQEEEEDEDDMEGSEDGSGSNSGSDDNDDTANILMDAANAIDNENGDNISDNDDDDAQSQQSDDSSWTDISDVNPNYDPNNSSDSSDLNALEDLLFG